MKNINLLKKTKEQTFKFLTYKKWSCKKNIKSPHKINGLKWYKRPGSFLYTKKVINRSNVILRVYKTSSVH